MNEIALYRAVQAARELIADGTHPTFAGIVACREAGLDLSQAEAVELHALRAEVARRRGLDWRAKHRRKLEIETITEETDE